jgi:hypothetical protein
MNPNWTGRAPRRATRITATSQPVVDNFKGDRAVAWAAVLSCIVLAVLAATGSL